MGRLISASKELKRRLDEFAEQLGSENRLFVYPVVQGLADGCSLTDFELVKPDWHR